MFSLIRRIMSRPKKRREICFEHGKKFFKPAGVPLSVLEIVKLSHEEMEALRLKHLKKLSQTDAAKEMKISQSTFQRVLGVAHFKISKALINTQAIEVDDFNSPDSP